jgi:hypothetical protein
MMDAGFPLFHSEFHLSVESTRFQLSVDDSSDLDVSTLLDLTESHKSL